jgi:hypothetical protein
MLNTKEFCTLTPAYNDEKLIGGMLKGVEDLYNLVIISKPWKGEHVGFDSTGDIAKRMGADVIYKDFGWNNTKKGAERETEQRNFGLNYLYNKNFKYVLILDSDEYYTKESIYKIMDYVLRTDADSYIIKNVKIYWTDWKYYYQYRGGTTCIRANHMITHKRCINKKLKNISLPMDIILHHFTYSGTEQDMKRKADTRPYLKLNYKWIDKYWKNWKEGMKYENKEIIKTKEIPEEILGRYIKSINLLY